MNKNQNFKNTGITLVALVVTIIILLILASISIATLTGSGLFENARLAEQKSKNAQELENATLKDYENKIGEYINSNRDQLTTTQIESLAKFDEELLDLSKYSSDGLTIYDSRITNLQGGYRTIGNVVYVYIVATTAKDLNTVTGSWMLLTGLPEPENTSVLNGFSTNTAGTGASALNSIGILKDSSVIKLCLHGSIPSSSTVVIKGNYLKAQ